MSLLSNYTFSAAFISAIFVAAVVISRYRNRTLKDIRGPSSSSFWLGNIADMRYQNEVGDVEFAWLREYGGAWKVNGCLGEERLMLADAKALQYVLQTSGYRFPKQHASIASARHFAGDGVGSVDGEHHRRQRKIMNPAFSAPQLKSFLSLFTHHGQKLAQKWRDQVIPADPTGEPLVNVHMWLSRTTLDVIGLAGFGYEFGALENLTNPVSKQYEGLFTETTLYPHAWDVVFKYFWKFLPIRILDNFRYIPSREYSRFREYQDFMRAFGRDLIAKGEAKTDGKDIMSVLIRADQAEEERLKLSETEILDQISTLLLAGHDTTSLSLSWWLWELAKNPEWQTRAREELRTVRTKVIDRGDGDFTLADLEGMSIMHATLKEAMRLHPIVWSLMRESGRDDAIPLAEPITTKSGEQISAIPVKKGQTVVLSLCAYNRNPDVWGKDADKWNPERFLSMDKSQMTPVGLYANLLNFSSGVRGCIGWRFSVIEMQAIAAVLLENFEFRLPEQSEKNKILRKPSDLMGPTAEGHQGAWMGLHVRSAN